LKKNPMWYLGFVGLLGLAGLVSGNAGFSGFFGFFGFFGLARQTDDEMLRHNLSRAGLNAFVVSMLGFPAVIIIGSFADSLETLIALFGHSFGILFVIQILTFVISFNLYEKRGNSS